MQLPAKFTGHTTWADIPKCGEGQIRDAIFRSDSELVLSLEYEGRAYDVQLKRDSGTVFRGTWSLREGGKVFQGPASCKVFSRADECFLFGRWDEDGVGYHWWAELDPNENAPS